jgi:hypothetical protein
MAYYFHLGSFYSQCSMILGRRGDPKMPPMKSSYNNTMWYKCLLQVKENYVHKAISTESMSENFRLSRTYE